MCIPFPFIAYTHDDLRRKIRDYIQSFGKGCQIIRRAEFLEEIWYDAKFAYKYLNLLITHTHTHSHTFSYSNIPLLECTPKHKRQSSAFLRDFDALKACLDAIFHSKIIEARKYVPTVTQALKNGILSDVLVPELVQWFLEFGVLLSSEQFDLIVKFMNCALVDEHSALLLLPLTTIIYRVSWPRSSSLQLHDQYFHKSQNILKNNAHNDFYHP